MEDTARDVIEPMSSNEVEADGDEWNASVEQTEALEMRCISNQIENSKVKYMTTHHIIIRFFLLLFFRLLLLRCLLGCGTASSSSRYPTHSGRCRTSSSYV